MKILPNRKSGTAMRTTHEGRTGVVDEIRHRKVAQTPLEQVTAAGSRCVNVREKAADISAEMNPAVRCPMFAAVFIPALVFLPKTVEDD